MAMVKENLPVLNAVVETGNESIIQSTRLGHEVLAELESLRQGAQPHNGSATEDRDSSPTESENHPGEGGDSAEEQGSLHFDFTSPVEVNAELDPLETNSSELVTSSDEFHDPLLSEVQPTVFNNQQLEDDEIELMIDEVIDRHITELRKDIKRLLERAKNVP